MCQTALLMNLDGCSADKGSEEMKMPSRLELWGDQIEEAMSVKCGGVRKYVGRTISPAILHTAAKIKSC